ncbi:hypothetical protein PybrP1_005421 [[Pythium] brassicae (nom. inval.)]|nr:hypothetical protein PybrP1_005421 [[Pythium] brassicae (nom. inval.)]
MDGTAAQKQQRLCEHDEVASPRAAKKPKTKYHRKWENTFGRHTARCHPRSVVDLIAKEGKPIVLLIVIGVCASTLDYVIETAVEELALAKEKLLALDAVRDSPNAMFAVWSAFTVVLAGLACVWTAAVDPLAAGSGIPEMKTIISCDLQREADRHLGARTLVSKAGGLTLALASGISVGREGPFVHLAAVIAHQLMKNVGFFRRIYANDILRRHMYNAACAVGVASTFRAPIGGVLLSIEVTSTVFMLSNYWRAFVAALSGSIARQVVSLLREPELATYRPMFPTLFDVRSFVYAEYLAFTALGLVMGATGALYVVLSDKFKRWWKAQSAAFPLLSGMVLLVPVCLLLYLPGPGGRSSSGAVLADLFDTKKLARRWSEDGALPSVFTALPLAGLCRLAATILSTSLLLPAGDFVPMFMGGAMFGRLFGELLAFVFPAASIVPGGYALVGGAALVAASTQTLSVAVIAMEFTGQFVYLNPLLLAVMVASSVGSALSVSVYESAILSKGLPYLPILRVNLHDDVKARDVMETVFPLLTLATSARKLHDALALEPTHSIPVVSDAHTMVFYGCLARSAVDRIYADHLEQLESARAASTRDSFSKESEARRCSSPTFRSPGSSAVDRVDPTELVQLPKRSSLQVPTPTVSGADTASGPTTGSTDGADLVIQTVVRVARADDTENEEEEAPVHLRTEDETLRIDSSVLQVDAETAISKVHLLFELIKCSRVWVTRRGRLVGRIDRAHLHAKVTERQHARNAPNIV